MTEQPKTVYTEEKTRELLLKYLEETGIKDNLKSSIEKFLVSYRIFYRTQLDYLDKNFLIPNEIKEKIKRELEEESSMIESIFIGKDQHKLAKYITNVLPQLTNDLQSLLSEIPEEKRKRFERAKSMLDVIKTLAYKKESTNQKHP